MKRFEPFELDRIKLRNELAAFEALLGPDTKELSEQKDVLPFFKRNTNLASLIGFAKSHLLAPDVIKTEFPFVGDHACDLAVGERQDGKGQFCFVEFEDAESGSVFRQGGKGTPDWSARLEHGFSRSSTGFTRSPTSRRRNCSATSSAPISRTTAAFSSSAGTDF